ncbi:MAG: ribonuclease HI family protein [Candidatus Daviesbacteria bacterium]|nr:ribonuclease HI family protein [Candidatus Daviesbacteria bacterium]
MKRLTVFTDGASRGNPGPASFGYVITDENKKIVHEMGKTLGITTNNVAEYTSVLESLKYICKKYHKDLPIEVNYFADSRLVVEQLSGRFKVKSPHLREIIIQINELIVELGKVAFNHVPREKNKDADRLANLALDGKIF